MAETLLKWAGGKAKIADDIIDTLDVLNNRRFVEPFAGGAATTFRARTRGFTGRVWLNDLSIGLINFWTAVQLDPVGVSNAVEIIDAIYFNAWQEDVDHAERLYYVNRTELNIALRDDVQDLNHFAALWLTINKWGFNGLWRCNRKGECNVPWGKRYARLPNLEEIQTVSTALTRTRITNIQANQCIVECGEGDTGLVDPPYEAEFAGYTGAAQWGATERNELLDCMALAAARGARLLLTNRYSPELAEACTSRGGVVEAWQERVSINRDGGGRGLRDTVGVLFKRDS